VPDQSAGSTDGGELGSSPPKACKCGVKAISLIEPKRTLKTSQPKNKKN